MPAQRVDIEIEQGATFRLILGVKNPDETPVDLTGAHARMQLRERYGDPVVLELTDTDGRIVFGAGTVTLVLTAEQTAAMNVTVTNVFPAKQSLIYDLFLTLPSGDRQRIVFGEAKVSAAVTR